MTTPSAGPRKPSKGPVWIFLATGLLLIGCVLGGGIYGLWQLMLETGAYPSSHGFHIDGKAYRALQEAQKTKPGTHLVVQTQGAMVGPEMYTELHLAETFDDKDFVRVSTRGMTLEVERYLYDHRVLQPVISHKGDKPTTGYTLTFSSR